MNAVASRTAATLLADRRGVGRSGRGVGRSIGPANGAGNKVRGSRWYEHQEPLDDRAVAPDRGQALPVPLAATGRTPRASSRSGPSCFSAPSRRKRRVGRRVLCPGEPPAQGVRPEKSRQFRLPGVSSTDGSPSSTATAISSTETDPGLWRRSTHPANAASR